MKYGETITKNSIIADGENNGAIFLYCLVMMRWINAIPPGSTTPISPLVSTPIAMNA